jgi:23S rRNA (guanosine2251-2'-O)-methyltransferase
MAKKQGVPVYRVPMKEKIIADVSPVKFSGFDEIINKAISSNSFILFLDNVVDQRNIGACIRTAEFFGSAGAVIPKRKGGGIGEGALRASAGAVFHIPIARVENIASALKKLKKYGFMTLAADLDGEDLRNVSFTNPAAIVVGGEDKGVSQPVKKQCDAVVKILGSGKTSSLNLSVAAGILMYELCRQKY